MEGDRSDIFNLEGDKLGPNEKRISGGGIIESKHAEPGTSINILTLGAKDQRYPSVGFVYNDDVKQVIDVISGHIDVQMINIFGNSRIDPLTTHELTVCQNHFCWAVRGEGRFIVITHHTSEQNPGKVDLILPSNQRQPK